MRGCRRGPSRIRTPPGPSFVPEYHNPEAERAVALNERASAMFEAGTAARETADRYVRMTVLLATCCSS